MSDRVKQRRFPLVPPLPPRRLPRLTPLRAARLHARDIRGIPLATVTPSRAPCGPRPARWQLRCPAGSTAPDATTAHTPASASRASDSSSPAALVRGSWVSVWSLKCAGACSVDLGGSEICHREGKAAIWVNPPVLDRFSGTVVGDRGADPQACGRRERERSRPATAAPVTSPSTVTCSRPCSPRRKSSDAP